MQNTARTLSGAHGYADAVPVYRECGWPSAIPLPPGKKKEPPKGFTGNDGKFPTDDEYAAFVVGFPNGNIALRLPDGVIGIDVDAYAGKVGANTLREFESKFGPLPPAWISTSRNDGISGIRLYRVQPGVRFRGEVGPGVEVVQTHHRYIVVAPSVHPNTGARYRWVAPDGSISITPPRIDDLTKVIL